MLVLVLMFDQLFGQLSSQLVAIRPLSNELFALLRFNRSQMSRSTLIAWLVNCWFDWLILLILFLQSFSWAVQDGIILLNNYASISNFYRNCLRIPRDHLDSFDPRSFHSTSMKDPLYYSDHSSWRIIPLLVKDQINKANVDIPRIKPYCVQLVISFAIVLHNGSHQGFH